MGSYRGAWVGSWLMVVAGACAGESSMDEGPSDATGSGDTMAAEDDDATGGTDTGVADSGSGSATAGSDSGSTDGGSSDESGTSVGPSTGDASATGQTETGTSTMSATDDDTTGDTGTDDGETTGDSGMMEAGPDSGPVLDVAPGFDFGGFGSEEESDGDGGFMLDVAGSAGAPACTGEWFAEDVAVPATPLQLGHSLRVAPDGSLHAFFNTNAVAYHAERTSSGWDLTQWSPGTAVWAEAGAVDADGVVHVAYRANGDALYYQRREDGVWTEETAAFGGCGASSMQIGSDGTVHIAGYIDGDDDHTLCYGTRSIAGVWSVESVDDAFHRGASLLLDDLDQPSIAYYGPGLRFATRSVVWSIDDIGYAGIDPAMVRAGSGDYIIGHSESPAGSIVVTTGELGGWSAEYLADASTEFHTAAPAVGLDPDDGLHLAHPDPADERCLVHRWRVAADEAWSTEYAVDDNDSLAALAFGADGQPHVLYQSTDGALRHATPSP